MVPGVPGGCVMRAVKVSGKDEFRHPSAQKKESPDGRFRWANTLSDRQRHLRRRDTGNTFRAVSGTRLHEEQDLLQGGALQALVAAGRLLVRPRDRQAIEYAVRRTVELLDQRFSPVGLHHHAGHGDAAPGDSAPGCGQEGAARRQTGIDRGRNARERSRRTTAQHRRLRKSSGIVRRGKGRDPERTQVIRCSAGSLPVRYRHVQEFSSPSSRSNSATARCSPPTPTSSTRSSNRSRSTVRRAKSSS